MYGTCLFCSADLGRNEAIETFPVGGRIAFDAWKGRLWAVCRRCGRWNLAPIEERWEAVEAAERLFTGTRTRVHTENIGLCRLRDGTSLVRVGQALPGELAAWRYGTQLISRRRRHLLAGGAAVIGAGALLAGMPFLASAGAPIAALSATLNLSGQWRVHRELRRIVHQLPAAASPTGQPIIVRRNHLHDAVLTATADDIGVLLPPVVSGTAASRRTRWRSDPDPPLLVTGDEARRLLARSMTDYNNRGARAADVDAALSAIENAGGAVAFTRQAAATGSVLTRARLGRSRRQAYSLRQVLGTFRGEILPVQKYRDPFRDDARPRLSRVDALALEMALNDEAERRALEGELAALEAAWREAESIARIADALPSAAGE